MIYIFAHWPFSDNQTLLWLKWYEKWFEMTNQNRQPISWAISSMMIIIIMNGGEQVMNYFLLSFFYYCFDCYTSIIKLSTIYIIHMEWEPKKIQFKKTTFGFVFFIKFFQIKKFISFHFLSLWTSEMNFKNETHNGWILSCVAWFHSFNCKWCNDTMFNVHMNGISFVILIHLHITGINIMLTWRWWWWWYHHRKLNTPQISSMIIVSHRSSD